MTSCPFPKSPGGACPSDRSSPYVRHPAWVMSSRAGGPQPGWYASRRRAGPDCYTAVGPDAVVFGRRCGRRIRICLCGAAVSEIPSRSGAAARAMILPLALAQFIASYAATNMNVAITPIAKDLGTTVAGVQTAITVFTLTMAALMIPGSKLTDIWGRKRCFVLGLIVYGVGGVLALLSFGLPQLIIGYSPLEGIGSALMIPPIYILVTVAFPDIKSRARYFGVISGAGGLGAAAGPLIGGVVTSAISWRASFGLQVLIVAWIVLMARRITDPPRAGPAPRFDLEGAVLSAAGLFFVVLGLLESRTYGFFVSRQAFKVGGTVVIPEGSISPVWLFVAIGALFLLWFFLHVRSRQKKGRDVQLPLRLFRSKIANLG